MAAGRIVCSGLGDVVATDDGGYRAMNISPGKLFVLAFLNALGLIWPVLYAMALWAASKDKVNEAITDP